MKACIFTLGCKMNEAESASLQRALEELGWETADMPCRADLYLLNTCAVTAEAEKKSRQAVARLRKYNEDAPVVVFGCASQHAPEAFSAREGVLYVAGTAKKDVIARVIGAPDEGVFDRLAAARGEESGETSFCELPFPKRTKTRALLRVQDGCDRFCSYCLIPYLRGRSRSRTLSSVLAEASHCDAREIVLTGIDLSSWHDGPLGLGDLVYALRGIPARIRLGSLEVSAVGEEFLEKMKAAGNVAPHFHLSLQSGSTRVLRAMNRHYTREEYLAAVARIGNYFENAAVTTDLIVGFPTETEEDFLDSLSIVEEAGFSRVHAFPFSAREGTNAARLRGLPPAVKKERMERMLQACRAAEEKYLSRFLGKRLTVLFEEDGGYSENYLRVYNETAEEGSMYEVELTKPYKDGAACTLVSKIG